MERTALSLGIALALALFLFVVARPFAALGEGEFPALSAQASASGDDAARKVAVDGAGNVFVVGAWAGNISGDVCMSLCDAFVRKFDGQGDVLFLGEGMQEFDGFAGDAVKFARRAVGGISPRVEARQRQQRFGELAHALGGALTGLEGRAVFAAGAFAGQRALRLGEDD